MSACPSMPTLHDALLFIQTIPVYEEQKSTATIMTRKSIERNAHKPCSKCMTAPRNIGKTGKPTSTMCASCEREMRKSR